MNTTRRAQVSLSDAGAEVRLPGRWAGWMWTLRGDAITVAPPPRHRITTEEWRAMPLGRIRSLAEPVLVGDIGVALVGLMADTDGDPWNSSRRGPLRHLRSVVAVYRTALEQGLPPRATVANYFGREGEPVPNGTVNRWIDAARKATPNGAGVHALPLGLEADEARRWRIETPTPTKRRPIEERIDD